MYVHAINGNMIIIAVIIIMCVYFFFEFYTDLPLLPTQDRELEERKVRAERRWMQLSVNAAEADTCCAKGRRELDDNDDIASLIEEILSSPKKEPRSLNSHTTCISSRSSAATTVSGSSVTSTQWSNTSVATLKMTGGSGRRVSFKLPVQTYSYMPE